jgi:hypothetical protein
MGGFLPERLLLWQKPLAIKRVNAGAPYGLPRINRGTLARVEAGLLLVLGCITALYHNKQGFLRFSGTRVTSFGKAYKLLYRYNGGRRVSEKGRAVSVAIGGGGSDIRGLKGAKQWHDASGRLL